MLGTSAGLTGFLVIEETYGKLRRGEPLAKPSGVEQDAIDAREHSQGEDKATRVDSRGARSIESSSEVRGKTQ